MNLRRHAVSLAALVLACTLPANAKVSSVDALASARRAAPMSVATPHDLTGARVAHMEERLGVPTFVWAAPRASGVRAPLTPAMGSLRAESEARRAVAEYAPLWHLAKPDLDGMVLTHVHDTGTGPIIASFRSVVDGVEVFREQLHVGMARDLSPIALSGYLAPAASLARAGSFGLDRREAVAIAFHDVTGASLDPGELVSERSDERYEQLDWRPAHESGAFAGSIRVKRVWFHLPDELVPGWYLDMRVAAAPSTDADYVAWVISAVDGRVLYRQDLTAADSFSYRVWADTTGIKMPFISPAGKAASPNPTGVPDGYQATFVPPNLVSLQNGPISTNDPWLAPGATVTTGNNADAYADLNAPDGFSAGDLRATVTSPGVFDRTLDTAGSPTANSDARMAVITQLFYDVNFFHDWYYGSGFDEKAGNAQQSNYGRGGHEGDPLRAEAQDYSGRNNANMATPPDGTSPRMQMYLFDGNGAYSMTVNAPASLAGAKSSTLAAFGPQSFQMTGNAVLLQNGTLHDACTAVTNASALAGKIAILDRGTCTFVVKVKAAQVAGAVGVVLVDDGRGIITMGGTDTTITIPSMLISQPDGAALEAATGVNVTLRRDAAPDRDGGVDQQIVGHEWGHYISNRLISDANGLNTNMAGGLGEGWADFHAMLLTVKEADAALPVNASWSGVYAMAGYVMSGYGDRALPNDGYYFGIRRAPYSTDFTKNALTFKHIQEGVPLPTTAPLAFGADGVGNSEVHNTGEVWCEAMWESYAAILNDSRYTFTQAQSRMKDILVASYKLTPVNPTFLEARDAVLAAALAFDAKDYVTIAKAFARRGAGTRAVAPDRYDMNNLGVVESYLASGDLALVSYSLDDGLVSCDMDGYLDKNETGRLKLVFKNVGTGPLSGTTVTLTSTTAGVSIASPIVYVPPTQPMQSATVTIPVSLTQGTAVLELDLTAVVNDPTFAQPLTLPFAFRANADDVAASSATDDVESAHPVWTATAGWSRVAVTDLDHRWRAIDIGEGDDLRLTSPSFTVTGNLQVTFKHRYDFPWGTDSNGANVYLDGGVFEASTDGGTSWTDVMNLGVADYTNGRISSGYGSPLSGRKALIGTSTGFPALATKTLDFGSALSGKTVKFRFRAGTTFYASSALIWEIDDIAFSGTSSKPFATIVPHRAQCLQANLLSMDANPKSVTYGDHVTLTAASGATSGTITFLDGGVALGTAALDSAGHASLQTTALAVGTHALTAFLPGTATTVPSTSNVVTVTVAHATGTISSTAFVPIVLDVDNGVAHYVSELTLTNPGTLPVTATLAYTASMGSGTGTAAPLVLAPGEQRILPDALTMLRIGGLSIPFSSVASQGGTLAVSFDNVTSGSLPAATVRTGALTASPQPVGFAGLAYGGLSSTDAITTTAALFGLRASASDRSHVAVFNTGSVPVTLKLTVFSGAGDGKSVVVDTGKTLAAGAWFQYSFLLDNAGFGTTGITTGWAVVERTSASGSFGTYGVINDNTTNDGSFIQPVTGAISGSGITLPVLVETPQFRSELVLANRGAAAATLALGYRESNTPGSGAGGTVSVTLAAGEERIVPEAIDYLRTHGATIGAKDAASYVGAVRVSVSGVDTSSVFVGARTASQSTALVGGQFGLFTPGVYSGQEASTSAALYGLRVDANNRSNVAVLNAGADAAGPVTLSIQAYDGAAGGIAKGSPTVVTLQPGDWKQYGSILSDAKVADGWVVVRRTSGTAPWIAYAVINDGGNPGERTGDGAYVPMSK